MEKAKRTNQNIPDVRFLDGVVDECDINGDVEVRDRIFSCGRPQWNPKVLDWEPSRRSGK